MNRFLLITLCVGLMGLVGPLVSWLSGSMLESIAPLSEEWADFRFGVVTPLWPAEILGMMGSTIGSELAGAIAIGVNLLLFTILGAMIAVGNRIRGGLVVVYVVTMLLMSAWVFLVLGFLPVRVWYLGFATAVLIYTIPFAVIWRQDGRAGR